MATQTELYRNESPTDMPADPEVERRGALVEELGFNPKMQSVDEASLEPSRYYQELTGFRLHVWMYFHATVYSKNSGEWAGYHFDRVPTNVLEEIRTAGSLGVFDDIEVWTPETPVRRHEDPLVVGVVGVRTELPRVRATWGGLRDGLTSNIANSGTARFFPIARWGESLLPFEVIRDKVVLARINQYASMPPVPSAVLEYIEKALQANPLVGVFKLEKAFGRPKHCKKRMYTVNDVRVCTVCGATA